MGSVDVRLIGSDLPRPNLVEEDSYGGGGVKISAASVSTAVTRSRQCSSSSPVTMKQRRRQFLGSSSGREVERSKNEVRKGRGIYNRSETTVRPKNLDKRAPDPSHSLDMCHPRTERWRSCEIVGEQISIIVESGTVQAATAKNSDQNILKFRTQFLQLTRTQ